MTVTDCKDTRKEKKLALAATKLLNNDINNWVDIIPKKLKMTKIESKRTLFVSSLFTFGQTYSTSEC